MRPVGWSSELKLVLDNAVCDLGQIVVSKFTALSVNHTLAYYGDILCTLSHNQTIETLLLRVVVRIGASYKYSSLAEFDGYVILQLDASGEIATYLEDELSAAFGADVVYGLLNRSRIERGAV